MVESRRADAAASKAIPGTLRPVGAIGSRSPGRSILLVCAFVIGAAVPASASFLEVDLACPEEAPANTVPVVDVDLISFASELVNVKLSAGYLAAGSSTLFGQTVIGPSPAANQQALRPFEPRTVLLDSLPSLPASPDGGVVEFFLVARAETIGGVEAVVADGCLIALPEPGFGMGLLAGALGLAAAQRSVRRRSGE